MLEFNILKLHSVIQYLGLCATIIYHWQHKLHQK